MLAEESFVIKNPKVIHEMIDGESVIINLETGVYYSMSQSATAVWNLIHEKASTDQILSHLMQRYEADPGVIAEGLKQFLTELKNESLVGAIRAEGFKTESLEEESDEFESPVPKLPFKAPKLSKYSDMQDYLFVNPTHEIHNEGWPQFS